MLNVILFSILFMYILIEELSVFSSCFLRNIQNNLEYDPPGNSNTPFHVGADILNLLFLYDFFIFFHV